MSTIDAVLRGEARWCVVPGNNLTTLRSMPDNSVDSIVCDPPYGLRFMSRRWDYDVPTVEQWAECLRVLKPGGHLLAFAGTRTQHRMCVRIEDAGFEIRDIIAWAYGSGFPKSHNVANDIDKKRGHGARGRAIPTASTYLPSGKYSTEKLTSNEVETYVARTEEAEPWTGWGTALKPALEPITLARKPLESTVAENVLEYGTGAINVDGCRVGTGDDRAGGGATGKRIDANGGYSGGWGFSTDGVARPTGGRFPANLIHDGSDEVLACFPDAPGQMSKAIVDASKRKNKNTYGSLNRGGATASDPRADEGSAARFFYCPKASKYDRDDGLESFDSKIVNDGRVTPIDNAYQRGETQRKNTHPTVKPTELMRYLCRLITPPGGIVLDPWCGSGSTGRGAILEGFRFIGCELSDEYVPIALARIAAVENDSEASSQVTGQIALPFT